MRPRKIVLLVDTNDFNLSVRSFVLGVWRYRPIKARSAIEAMKILEERKAYSIYLILVGDGITATEVLWIAERAKQMLHPCPIYGAGMNTDSHELRAGIKTKTSRKSGPRDKVKPMAEFWERAA